MEEVEIKYVIDPACPVPYPIKPPAYPGDVGFDLATAIFEPSVTISPGQFLDVPTYIRLELPTGWWGDIRSRSSTFAKRKILVMPGTIDVEYRGAISVFLFNPNPEPVTIYKADYLAQLVLIPTGPQRLTRVPKLTITERGERGFGSSDAKQS